MTTASAPAPVPHPLPAAMRAVVQRRYGDPLQVLHLIELPVPTPGDDEVLVEVHAASVNTPDWITVTGTPAVLRLRFGLFGPATPVRGTDVAGVVAAVGRGVTDLQPGDAVFGSTWSDSLANPSGSFAEYAVAPASRLVRAPAGLSFEEAGASPMSGLTALIALRDVAAVGPGTTVLINGASGGVGTFAVQIARARGAEVTGVCSTANVALVRALGAHHVVDYTVEDFTRSDRRYDVVLDNVMNHPPAAVARLLAPDGQYLPNSIGAGGALLGGLPRIARAALMRRARTVSCAVNRTNLASLADLLADGTVRAVIDEVYPLADTPRAVSRMLSRRARGQVVVRVR